VLKGGGGGAERESKKGSGEGGKEAVGGMGGGTVTVKFSKSTRIVPLYRPQTFQNTLAHAQ
jgi:hypothetical protein